MRCCCPPLIFDGLERGVGRHLDHFQRLLDPGRDFLLRQLGDPQSVADVFRDGQMREQERSAERPY